MPHERRGSLMDRTRMNDPVFTIGIWVAVAVLFVYYRRTKGT